MTTSKFEVGQHVRFTSHTIGRPAAPDFYSVLKVLPREHAEVEQRYQIKCTLEPYERIAQESQLEEKR